MEFNERMMAEKIASDLLIIKAVFLRLYKPFIWASGIKSPIYCDNRLILAYPQIRTAVENGLVEILRREYESLEVVYGTSTAGISHASIVADIMGLPMGYVRASVKDHGRKNLIEGASPEGKKWL